MCVFLTNLTSQSDLSELLKEGGVFARPRAAPCPVYGCALPPVCLCSGAAVGRSELRVHTHTHTETWAHCDYSLFHVKNLSWIHFFGTLTLWVPAGLPLPVAPSALPATSMLSSVSLSDRRR